jgi:regulator of sigma E protease
MILTLITFLLVLSVLVLIHEAGHYFVAKFFKIKVEEFGYGFPPRLFAKKIGETEYSLNWLPIGGFVKLFGEDDAGGGQIGKSEELKVKSKKDLDRAFFARPAWQRALVVLAGVIMNVLLAIVIYYVYLGISGFKAELPLLTPHTFFGVNQTVNSDIIISGVEKDSPASAAGITAGSEVVSVDNKPATSADRFLAYISSHKGKQITLTWKDLQTNKQTTRTLTPRLNAPKGQGSLGISFYPVDTAVLSYDTPVQKVFSGIIHPLNLMDYNFVVIGHLIQVSFQQKTAAPISEGLSGPVGIYSVVGLIVHIPDMKERILNLLNLAGLLSMSLAFFNVLPIPALDGGRLFFILIELVTRRKVSQKFEATAHQVGMILLLGLLLLITFKDVFQIFH